MKTLIALVALTVFISGCNLTSASGELNSSQGIQSKSKTKSNTASNKNRGRPNDACSDEIPELCSEASPEEIRECVDSVYDQLSAECQADVTKRKAGQEAVKTACAADLAEYCSDVEERYVHQCMGYYHIKGLLSDECEEAARANPPPGPPPGGGPGGR